MPRYYFVERNTPTKWDHEFTSDNLRDAADLMIDRQYDEPDAEFRLTDDDGRDYTDAEIEAACSVAEELSQSDDAF